MIESQHVIHRSRLRLSLAGMVVSIGFASITLYMGSTIFYPLLQLDEFAAKALHNGMLDVLMSRYIGYLPLIVFGSISVITGNWFWYTKKETSNIVIVIISALFFITFVVLIVKNFV